MYCKETPNEDCLYWKHTETSADINGTKVFFYFQAVRIALYK
jgi:hypothetical protein